jgi:hypothetical protein
MDFDRSQFLDNKYTSLYYKIVDNRRENRPSENRYCERHHIIPECFGGPDTKENLVRITGQEHYTMHRLLVKMLPDGWRKDRMIDAKMRMTVSNKDKNGNEKYIVTGRQFEEARKQFAEKNHRIRSTPENKEIFSKRMKKWHSSLPDGARKGKNAPGYKQVENIDKMFDDFLSRFYTIPLLRVKYGIHVDGVKSRLIDHFGEDQFKVLNKRNFKVYPLVSVLGTDTTYEIVKNFKFNKFTISDFVREYKIGRRAFERTLRCLLGEEDYTSILRMNLTYGRRVRNLKEFPEINEAYVDFTDSHFSKERLVKKYHHSDQFIVGKLKLLMGIDAYAKQAKENFRVAKTIHLSQGMIDDFLVGGLMCSELCKKYGWGFSVMSKKLIELLGKDRYKEILKRNAS